MQYKSSWLATFIPKYFIPIIWIGCSTLIIIIYELPEAIKGDGLAIGALVVWGLITPFVILMSLLTKMVIATENELQVSSFFRKFYIPYSNIERINIFFLPVVGSLIIKFRKGSNFPWRWILTIPQFTTREIIKYFYGKSEMMAFIKQQIEQVKK